MVLILLSSDNVSSSLTVIKLSNCSLYTTLHCLWQFQYKPYMSVLNGLKCDIPSAVLQWHINLKRWFEHFVIKWCLINVQEMEISHGLIIQCMSTMQTFKVTLNCIFKFGPFLESNWSVDFNYQVSVVIFIFKTMKTFFITFNFRLTQKYMLQKHKRKL